MSWSFNTEMELPVLPVIHGTQSDVAWKIASTGFAALSSLDAGYFGKGIYFTSSCQYSAPYTQFGELPCMILALIIPGNIYPVIEQHKGDYSLMGNAITPGCNSHYVRTHKDGSCVSQPENKSFDELIMEQEAQIVPIAILELDQSGIKAWQSKMNRETTFDDQSRPISTTSTPPSPAIPDRPAKKKRRRTKAGKNKEDEVL